MKATIFIGSVFFLLASCKKDFGNLNAPVEGDFLTNASRLQLDNLVTGIESGMRIRLSLYLNEVGIIGREVYRFSPSEPAYTTELLGKGTTQLSNTGFYITNVWAANYRVVKNCNLLEQACTNTSLVTADQKLAYTGFAKTIKAYSMLLNLNLTYTNGIRLNVSDPDHLGPILPYNEALAGISALLDSAKNELAGTTTALSLSTGFTNFNDAAGLIKFNRALAARVNVYRSNWAGALACLAASFFDLTADFNSGIYCVFGTGSGDQVNAMFIPQNQTGEICVAHPSYAADIEPGDDRISKATIRNVIASSNGLSGNRDVWVYTTITAPVTIIRNEELILIYAEAAIQTGDLGAGIRALNIIRNGHGLANYTGVATVPALLAEMLTQRRYSLYVEGHRWIDMRRYGLLQNLPLDRVGDDVWTAFPLPSNEL